MTDVDELLLQEAHKILTDLLSNIDKGTPDFQDLEYRMTQIMELLDKSLPAPRSPITYRPLVDDQPQCPNCWASNGLHIVMNQLAEGADILQCSICDYEIQVATGPGPG